MLILFKTSNARYCSLLLGAHRLRNFSRTGTRLPFSSRTICLRLSVSACSDSAKRPRSALAAFLDEVFTSRSKSRIKAGSCSITGSTESCLINFHDVSEGLLSVLVTADWFGRVVCPFWIVLCFLFFFFPKRRMLLVFMIAAACLPQSDYINKVKFLVWKKKKSTRVWRGKTM